MPDDDADREAILVRIRTLIAYTKLAQVDLNWLLERCDRDERLLSKIKTVLSRDDIDREIANALALAEMRKRAEVFSHRRRCATPTVCRLVTTSFCGNGHAGAV